MTLKSSQSHLQGDSFASSMEGQEGPGLSSKGERRKNVGASNKCPGVLEGLQISM